jgi:hypothetical protein
MNQHTVGVHAVQGGWEVDCSFSASPLMFLSGAVAEAKARTLAACAAAEGFDVTMEVHDQRDHIVATLHFYAET